MKKRSDEALFGTDGIRSQFGKFPLDPPSIKRIGSSIEACLGPVRILIGMDTRISGPEIEELICDGIGNSSEICSTGVVPTPALSYNVAKGPFDLGIMITASHNVWSDNGIKLFGPDGEKLPDKTQNRIDGIFYSNDVFDSSGSRGVISTFDGLGKYVNFVTSEFSGMKPDLARVLLDCANGAVSGAAPAVYSKLGIGHTIFNTTPDGKNINSGCGSMELDFLRRHIISGAGQLGVAFDGDGDRVLMIDSSGKDLDGDFILFIISKYLMESDPDYYPAIVGTIMSNLALEKSLGKIGINFYRSDVGDRYVYEEMKKRSAVLGGEQSGHVIYRALQKTGDGIVTSLLFLKALEFLRLSVSEASELYKPFPQVIRSIKIRKKKDLDSWEDLKVMTGNFIKEYGDNSRILIRYSGTERKIRLMIESEDENVINKNLEIFEDFLISEIGEEK